MMNIGKKRRLQEERKKRAALGIPEPYRKSLFEVMKENFALANRNIYLHRLIYIGEHAFLDSMDLSTGYEKMVHDVNKEYCIEKLSGFILHYARYFCVVIEGCEEILARHFDYLFTQSPCKDNFGRMKLLVCYHHCNKRFTDLWLEYSATPPTLLHPLDPDSNVEQTYKIVLQCITKLYKLGEDLVNKTNTDDEDDSNMSASAIFEAHATRRITLSASPSALINENRFINCLPEYAYLEHILNSPYTMKIEDYHKLYGSVPDAVFYKEKIWPTPCDFVPADVFETPKDPVTDFPPHLQPEQIT